MAKNYGDFRVVEKEDGEVYFCRRTIVDGKPANYNNEEIVIVPSEVTIIDKSCFERYPVKEVVLPDNLKEIKPYAFARSSLIKVSIPKNVKSLGWDAFSRCCDLTTLHIPVETSLNEIPNDCFSMAGLTEINLPEAIKKVGECAFSNCEKLVKVVIKGAESLELGALLCRVCSKELNRVHL